MANGILQPTQGSPFRPNVGAETISGIANILQQFQAGQQQGQQRQQQQQLLDRQQQSQILQDLLTKSQTEATTALAEQRRAPKAEDPLKALRFSLAVPLLQKQQRGEELSKDEQKQLFSIAGAGGGVTVNVGEGDTFNKQFERGFKLSSQFKSEPIIKTFPEIQKSVDNMEAAFEAFQADPSTFVAIDQALIASFNKILDPGSVVRESEFERTAQSLGLPQQIIGSLVKLAKGGAGLSNPDRLALVELARDLRAKAESRVDEKITEFETKAREGKVPRDFVLGGIQRFGQEIPSPTQGGARANTLTDEQARLQRIAELEAKAAQ